MDRVVRDTFFLVLYVLTSLLSIIGNGLVFRISLRRRTSLFSAPTINFSLSTTRMFLLNLALADTLLGLTIPIQLVFCSKYFLENSTSTPYVCTLNKSVEMLGYNASILTICLIAFDRYRLIRNPLQKYYRRKFSRAILIAWILSALFSANDVVSTRVYTYFNSSEKLISCQTLIIPSTTIYFFSVDMRQIRIFCFIILFYIIPLLSITILCLLTMRIIARRSVIGVQQFRTFERSRIRSMGLLMTSVIVFALSHSPIHFIDMRDFLMSSSKVSLGRSIQATKCNDSTIYLLFYWLSISSCCYNPLIYSWFNRKFRTLIFNCCRSIL